MVKNAENKKDLTKVSMAFIPSLKCNLSCSFCMYNASPTNNRTLDLKDSEEWLKTVDFNKIIGWGFYGGEPSIETELYLKFYSLLPKYTPSFVITNGSWSINKRKLWDFIDFCTERFHIIISGTQEHKKHQKEEWIQELNKVYPKAFTIKTEEEEEMHPMGRLAQENWTCSKKCIWHEQPIRIGIFPGGFLVLQNCDGVYPVLGNIKETSFERAFDLAVKIRTIGCHSGHLNLNDILYYKNPAATIENKAC